MRFFNQKLRSGTSRFGAAAVMLVAVVSGYVIIMARASTALPSDINNDSQVDVFDLSLLLANWGKTGAADVNSDGSVNVFDMSILLAHWGQTSGTATALCAGDVNWSDPATWGGTVPAPGSVVSIPAGKKVMLDVDAPHLNGFTIPAGTELCFPDRPTVFSSKYIAVLGKLSIGTDAVPVKSDITLRLEGGVNGIDDFAVTGQAATDIAAYNAKNGSTLKPAAGTNVLLAENGGVIDIYGEKRGTTWTQLGSPSAAGATSLALKSAMAWRAGDRVVVGTGTKDPLAFDSATITAVSVDGKTLTLAAPLKYRHAGSSTCLTAGAESRCIEERSEVGLLTHSVKITGPADGPSTHFGGHTMILSGGALHLAGAELYAMGQEAVLGRYPIHFHIGGDGGANSFVRDVSLHDNFNRQLAIHGTNKVKVSGMVANNSVGHSVMLENGYEEGNFFTNNLVMTTKYQPDATKRLLFSDNVPAAFWITNGSNDFVGNAVSGSQGSGFWYDMAGRNNDIIGVDYARTRPFGRLDNNIGHGVLRPDGVGPDEFTNSHEDGSAFITEADEHSRVGRGTANNNTAWLNGQGVWIQGGFDFVNTKSANNQVDMAAVSGYAKGGVYFAAQTNNDVPAEFNPKDSLGVFRFYHGQGDVDDAWVGGLNPSYAHAFGIADNSASVWDADSRLRNIRYFGPGYRSTLCFKFTYCNGTTDPNDGSNASHWVLDLDGSVLGQGDPSTPTGQPMFLYNSPLLLSDASKDKTLYTNATFDWDGSVIADFTRYRPLSANDQGIIRVRFGSDSTTDLHTIIRDDGVTQKGMLQAMLSNRTYTFKPMNGSAAFSSGFSFDWSGSAPGSVKVTIPWAENHTPVIGHDYGCGISDVPRPQASSLANLGVNGDWYYDSAAKKVYAILHEPGTMAPMGQGGYMTSGNNYWCLR